MSDTNFSMTILYIFRFMYKPCALIGGFQVAPAYQLSPTFDPSSYFINSYS